MGAFQCSFRESAFCSARSVVLVFLLWHAGSVFSPAWAAGADVIRVDQNPTRWTISTLHSTYQVILTEDNNLAPGYFGPLSGARLFEAPEYKNTESGTVLREIPYRGGFVELTPALEVIFPDRTRELELQYTGHETGELDGYPYIRFEMKDTHYAFQVSEYIRVIPELDIIEKWMVLKNTGPESVLVERAYSGSVLLPPDSYDLLHLSGEWGREFFPRRTRLTSGQKSLFIRGMKSQQHPPFFMLRPAGDCEENYGPVWFGSVAWSGNWRIDCEVNRGERTQVSGGINFWDTHWVLEGRSEFRTPEMIFGVSTDGPGGASRRLHRYLLDHVMPRPFSRQVSKILYNSWYATTFNVNEKDQVALARIAKDIGVELFVMDDGWFKGRNDDRAGLGDWTPDPVKFPKGLGPLIKEINALGMDFGIWVEPEMVNPNSDLFRAHPDWALHTPNRTAHQGRHQLVLNFAREEVKQFTLEWLDKLLSENNIKFIKWDMNRHVSEAGWPEVDPLKQRELRIRYAENLDEIFRTLRQRHPEVVFESCSSGGGRVNQGILGLVDQVWTSDNTDPGDRLQIQYGFSYAFPAKAMVNWVTDDEWHRKTTSLKFRFHVAMAGNLGVGSDLHQWTAEDKRTASELIRLYKSVRHIVQLGDQYRLRDPFAENRMAVQFVTRDKEESVVFAFQTLETLPGAAKGSSDRLILHGLDPEGTYLVHGDIQNEEIVGAVLLASGISVPLSGNYSSKVVLLRKKE
ncbi:MAG TPA: alpha-galactosidase [archaeon]|nr:alpha-galactosidase [archaeon]